MWRERLGGCRRWPRPSAPLPLTDGKMATDSDVDHGMEMLSDEELERYYSRDVDVIDLNGHLGLNVALPGLYKSDCRVVVFFFHMAQ